MKRASVFLLVGTAFAIGGMAFAHPHDKGESVRTIAEGTPVNRIMELAGPEALPMDEAVRRFLTAKGDPRPVVADRQARYFGAELNDHSLAPGESPRLGSTRLERWLSRLKEAEVSVA